MNNSNQTNKTRITTPILCRFIVLLKRLKMNKTKKETSFSRRSILPILGGGLLLPFLGFGKSTRETTDIKEEGDEEYQTLLKPDGTAVKVKVSTLKKSKIVQKNISNKSFLNWLGRKL